MGGAWAESQVEAAGRGARGCSFGRVEPEQEEEAGSFLEGQAPGAGPCCVTAECHASRAGQTGTK